MKVLKPLPKVIVETIDSVTIVRYGKDIIGRKRAIHEPDFTNAYNLEAFIKYRKELSHVISAQYISYFLLNSEYIIYK